MLISKRATKGNGNVGLIRTKRMRPTYCARHRRQRRERTSGSREIARGLIAYIWKFGSFFRIANGAPCGSISIARRPGGASSRMSSVAPSWIA